MTEPAKDEAEFVPMPRAPGVFGLSRSTLYVLAAQEKIRMVKMGARALVDAESVRKFLATLPEKKPRRDLRHELSNNDVTALAIFVVRAAGWAVVPVTEQDALRAENARLREALKGLLDYSERYTCQHEETHRVGFLWEICDVCGDKWADDMGGKTEWKDPPEWIAARAVLAGEVKT